MQFPKIRTIDYKGRITIPSVVLKKAGITYGDECIFEVSKANAIIIRKVKNTTTKNNNNSNV